MPPGIPHLFTRKPANTLRPIKIIGGGIAGLSLGIALRRSEVPVTLHEAAQYPRHRVCGEFLCGVSDKTLATLGIADAFNGCAFNRVTGWYRGDRRLLRCELPVPVRGLSRLRLDYRLAERFENAGGTLLTGERVAASELSAPPDGTVVATGKGSGKSEWLGLKVHLRAFPDATEDLQMYLGDRAYVGVSRIEDDRFNLCGLFRRRPSLKGQGTTLLAAYLRGSGLTTLADKLDSGHPVASSFSAISGFNFSEGRHGRNPRALRLGDAGGMIPPFTGNGMSLAIENVETVLPHVLAYADGEIDWLGALRRASHASRRKFRKRRLTAGILQTMLVRPLFQRLIMALVARNMPPFQTIFRLTH